MSIGCPHPVFLVSNGCPQGVQSVHFVRKSPPFLLPSGRAESAAILVPKVVCFRKCQRRLMRKYAELADSVIHLNHRIPEGKCRHEPLIIVAAVAFIHDAAVVRLDDAEVLEGRAARHNMRLKPLRKLHGNPQRNQLKFALFQLYTLCRTQVNPVGFPVFRSTLTHPDKKTSEASPIDASNASLFFFTNSSFFFKMLPFYSTVFFENTQ